MEEIATITPGTETPIAAEPTTETTETPTPETETPTTETPATETEGGGDSDETDLPGEPEDEGIETDGRTMDKATREAISVLKKTNPEAAKAVAKAYYGRQAYEKEFPTVQDARQAKATLEALGGQEGITQLQEEVQDFRTEVEQFSNGDRGLIEKLYKGNPESTVKMVEAALDIFAESGNVAAIDGLLLRPIADRLQQVGLSANLLKAAKFIEEGKGQEAYDTLGIIGQWLGKLVGDADKSKTNRTVKDPREEQFAQREQRLQQQERENFDRGIGEKVTVLNNNSLSKVIEPFFKEVRLKHEGRREFTQNLQKKVWEAMKADKVFQRDARNIKAKGDKDRMAQFMNAKFAELLPGIFRSYKNSLYPNLAKAAATPIKTNGAAPAAGGGKPAPKAAATPTNGAVLKVKDAPAFEDVDWEKTSDALWFRGQAHLKNGKHVSFY